MKFDHVVLGQQRGVLHGLALVTRDGEPTGQGVVGLQGINGLVELADALGLALQACCASDNVRSRRWPSWTALA